MPFALDVAIKASLLLLLAAATVAVARRAAAAERHFVWTLALAGLLILPVLAVALPWRLPIVPARVVRPPSQPVEMSAEVPAALTATRVAPRTGVAETPPPAATRAAGPEPVRPASGAHALGAWSLERGLRAVWIVGLALVLARLIVGVLAWRWLLRGAREVGDPEWIAALEAASERLDLTAPVRLLESPHANMPMAFGIRRPVVILPMEADAWPVELRETVLLHELAHVRRGDVLSNLLGQAACAVYWFHPLVWGAARRLRMEAERACDDLVLRAGAPPSAYAGHLLEMAQTAGTMRALAFSVPMAQRSEFEGRVLAILQPDLARRPLNRHAFAVGAFLLAAVAVPLAALGPARPESAQAEARATSRAEVVAHEVARVQATPVAHAEAVREAGVQASNPDPDPKPRNDPDPNANPQDEARLQGGATATAGLIAALADDDPAVRLAVARALGERQDTAAINALLQALRRDPSREVRKMAAWALGEIEDARAVPGLVAALRDERDVDTRRQIAWALGEIESADAVSGLGSALRAEDDAETRRMIVWALGEIESAEAVPHLTPLLRDADVELRTKVVWALGEIESPTAVEPLAALLAQERVVEVREMIVWALGEIEDARAAPALEAALRDTALAVRRKAVWALGELDGLRAAPAGLIAALRDADREVRRAAAYAVGELEDPAAVPGLAALLRDPDLEVRRTAIHALGEIRGVAASEALVAALRDEDPEIRRLAAQALGNR